MDPKRRQSRLIVSNAAVIWISQLLLLVPQLFLVPYLISAIGENGYGLYALVWSLMLSIDMLEKSLQSGVVKFSAAYLAQGRIGDVNKVISSSFIYSVFLGVVAFGGIILAAAIYKHTDAQFAFSLAVVAFVVLVITPLTPYIGSTQARQIYDVGAIAETVCRYVGLLVVIGWFEIVGPSVEALMVAMAGALILSRLGQALMAKRYVPGLANRLKSFDWPLFRQIAGFGFATVLASLCLAVNSTGVRWLMNFLASTSFVTHLVIILTPSLLLSQIVGATTVTVMPATSAYHAEGRESVLTTLLARGARYITILVLAILIGAGILLPDLLEVWVGAEYRFLATYALALFGSAALLQTTSVAHHMLKGIGQVQVVVKVYFVGLIVVPISSIFLIYNVSQDPYLSATFGLAAGNVVTACLHLAVCAKWLRANVWKLLLQSYVQPLAVAFLVVILVAIVSRIVPHGLGWNMVLAMLALGTFLGGSFALVATAAEREGVRTLIRHLVGRLRHAH